MFNIFKSTPKHIFSENGENIIYFDKKKEGIKCKFFKKNGLIDGSFITYYLAYYCPAEQLPSIKAEFKEGKIVGEATEFSITSGINAVVEDYKEGFLTRKRIYFTGSNRGELSSDTKYKVNDKKKGIIIDKIETILRQYNITNNNIS